jgi:hypothetical protein
MCRVAGEIPVIVGVTVAVRAPAALTQSMAAQASTTVTNVRRLGTEGLTSVSSDQAPRTLRKA